MQEMTQFCLVTTPLWMNGKWNLVSWPLTYMDQLNLVVVKVVILLTLITLTISDKASHYSTMYHNENKQHFLKHEGMSCGRRCNFLFS